MAAGTDLSKNVEQRLINLILIICVVFVQIVSGDEEEQGKPKEPAGYMRREFSITKPIAAGATLQYWQPAGNAMLTDEHVRLTNDEQSKSGAMWTTFPCYVRDWEIHMQFKVHGHNSRFFGDGFAFWYAKERNILGPVFGSKDHFSGLALFFDTYANQNGEHAHEHPYISAQVNNGSLHYDHDRDGTHTELAGCTSHFRGTDHETHVAIRYLGSKKRLTVQYDVEDDDKWQSCLDQYGVQLPTGYFIGFSGSTGDLSDNHDILSVKFYELETIEPSDEGEEAIEDYSKILPHAENAEAEREHVDDAGSTTRGQRILNWLMGIFVICIICGIGGFIYYQKYQADQRKRFY